MVAEEPIFAGTKGGRTKTVDLGKAGSDHYTEVAESIRRRNAIEQLEAQVTRVEELIDIDRTLPSAGEFQNIRVGQ